MLFVEQAQLAEGAEGCGLGAQGVGMERDGDCLQFFQDEMFVVRKSLLRSNHHDDR